MKRLSLSIPKEVKKALEERAAQERRSLSFIAVDAIRAYCEPIITTSAAQPGERVTASQ